jgi:hypothetical protein
MSRDMPSGFMFDAEHVSFSSSFSFSSSVQPGGKRKKNKMKKKDFPRNRPAFSTSISADR